MFHVPAHKNTAAPAAQLRAAAAPVSSGPDFTLLYHGSISILEPRTDVAREWLDENLAGEVQWWGNGVVVEARYVSNIVSGIESAGLAIN